MTVQLHQSTAQCQTGKRTAEAKTTSTTKLQRLHHTLTCEEYDLLYDSIGSISDS
jgi:hypothetical protein